MAKDAETLIKVTWDEIVAALSPDERGQREALRARQHELQARMPPPTSGAWAIADQGKTPPTHVLRRGEVKRKGAVVESGFPRVLRFRDRQSEIGTAGKLAPTWRSGSRGRTIR